MCLAGKQFLFNLTISGSAPYYIHDFIPTTLDLLEQKPDTLTNICSDFLPVLVLSLQSIHQLKSSLPSKTLSLTLSCLLLTIILSLLPLQPSPLKDWFIITWPPHLLINLLQSEFCPRHSTENDLQNVINDSTFLNPTESLRCHIYVALGTVDCSFPKEIR